LRGLHKHVQDEREAHEERSGAAQAFDRINASRLSPSSAMGRRNALAARE
jgi:hypothetical protein